MDRRPRILLLDDSRVNLLVCESQLSAAGYEVRTASSLDQFQGVLREWPPDIVLTDVHMPGLSGAELCRSLKADATTAHVAVVLYSALCEDDLTLLALQCGADGFVCKADTPDELPRRLQEICPTP
jgi:two-component system cell cycle response regulator